MTGEGRQMVTEAKEQGRDTLRLRRLLMAAGGAAALCALAWTARDAGLLRLDPVPFALIYGLWMAGFVAAVALQVSGRNRGLRDPSLTLPLVLWAGLGFLVSMLLAPALTPTIYLGLVVIGLFGAFRFSNARYVGVNLGLAAGAGLVHAVQRLLWPELASGTAATIGFAGYLVAMTLITLVGLEMAAFRRVLTERNNELTLAFERLRDMAIRDELTGIHNRRFLMDVLHQQKALVDRGEHRFSVCYMDLDHFKRVNDVFGHAKGDMVLKQFAEIAADAVRDVDYVARVGGEEFVLVLVGTPKDNAHIVAERIRKQMARLSISDLIPDFRISASCGITEYAKGESVEATLDRADAALYRAKRGGRDQVVVVDADDTPEPEAREDVTGGEGGIA